MARNRSIPSQAPLAILITEVMMVSETDPEQVYMVRPGLCPCKSFRFWKPTEKRPERSCKHTDALRVMGADQWTAVFDEDTVELVKAARQ